MAGASALHHLFAVTSGLESIAVGEEEIAGQVRRAYESARGARATTPELDTAFQRAAKVSRDVRGATAVGKAGRSLVQFALQLAGTRVTDWRQTRALIVGTGNYAATTVAALRTLGVSELSVYSLTGRAERFAESYGVLRAEHELRDAVAVGRGRSSRARTRYSVTVDDIPDESRRTIIDLGLPRNVDPAVGRLPGVELMDLELIATHARLPMLAPDATARELVSSAAGAFAAEQMAAPAIVALRRHVFDALDSELARLASKSVRPSRPPPSPRRFATSRVPCCTIRPSVRANSPAADVSRSSRRVWPRSSASIRQPRAARSRRCGPPTDESARPRPDGPEPPSLFAGVRRVLVDRPAVADGTTTYE